MHSKTRESNPTQDVLPEALMVLRQWVPCTFQTRSNGKTTKVPLVWHTNENADVTDPDDWSSFVEAIGSVRAGHANGIGFVLTEADPYAAIDLDDCRIPETGVIEPTAQAIIDRFDSYTEVSPSGTGIRILIRGRLPNDGKKRSGKIEVYDRERFVTVTGQALRHPGRIADRADELLAWHAEVFPETEANESDSRSPAMSDEEVPTLAFRARNGTRVQALWSGDTTGYSSHSEADQALCSHLAFYTQDREQLDRLFRQSGLYRDKWERRDYRNATLDKALSGLQAVYQGQRPNDRSQLTDMGNAARLAFRHGADLRYSRVDKDWLVWDGRRWARDRTGHVYALAKETVRTIFTEAGDAGDAEIAKQIGKWAVASQNGRRIEELVKLAQTEPGIAVVPEELDTDPWLLNVANGTIDLRTGALRPHDRADLITKLSPVVYEPEATNPVWESFLDEATQGDAALQAFLQRAAGYTLTGDISEEKFFYLLGAEGSGKTTFLEALATAMGDYAMTADAATFLTKDRAEVAKGDVARLAGARLVKSVEPDEAQKLANGLIKNLTGNETITARFLYGREFEFTPHFKIWIAANASPRIDEDDGGLWRRLLRLPFERRRSDEERDPRVKATVTDRTVGGPAVLAWAVRGCLLWQHEGLGVPPIVQERTQALRQQMDRLGSFIEDRCELDPDAETPGGTLYREYANWARDNGIRVPLANNTFARKLEERGFRKGEPTSRKRNVWLGIRVSIPELSVVPGSAWGLPQDSPFRSVKSS